MIKVKNNNTRMRVVTFKIDEDLLRKLDDYASIMGETRSEVIRKAIEDYISRNVRRMRRVKIFY